MAKNDEKARLERMKRDFLDWIPRMKGHQPFIVEVLTELQHDGPTAARSLLAERLTEQELLDVCTAMFIAYSSSKHPD